LFNSIQIQKYRDNKGKICPYCENQSVTILNKEELKIINPDRATQKMECRVCKRTWKEIYPMFNIEEIEVKNEEAGTK